MTARAGAGIGAWQAPDHEQEDRIAKEAVAFAHRGNERRAQKPDWQAWGPQAERRLYLKMVGLRMCSGSRAMPSRNS